jgi:hypothetical protein
MKLGKSVGALAATSVLIVAIAACQKTEGPAERAGKEIDQTSEKVEQKFDAAGNKIEKAADKTGEQLDKAGDKIKDAVKPATQDNTKKY